MGPVDKRVGPVALVNCVKAFAEDPALTVDELVQSIPGNPVAYRDPDLASVVHDVSTEVSCYPVACVVVVVVGVMLVAALMIETLVLDGVAVMTDH